jgi:hypothetical protein
MGKYTLKECVVFYFKVVRNESHYGERFSKLLPNIEKYFTDFWKRDGDIKTLIKNKDIVSKISNSCSDKVII